MKIGIIGSGVYSLALAHALSKNDNTIKIWTHDEEKKIEFDKNHKLESVIDCVISEKTSFHTDLKTVIEDADVIFIATTSNYFNEVIKKMKPYYKNSVISIATKGLDLKTNDFLSNTVERELKTNKICVISGPSFAIDIINDDIVSFTVGSKDNESLDKINQAIFSDSIKLELTNDIIGIQISNTFKNVVAIGTGLISALGYSNSTTAFLITKSLKELEFLIKKLGGNEKTVLSSAAVGDVILTCTSSKSRNYTYGQMLAEGEVKEITAEGYFGLKALYKLLKQKNINSEFITLFYKIVENDLDKNELISYLTK